MSSLEVVGWDALTLTDDLLAEILIRLPTLADHGRACAACAAFRRVITSPAFLRRLHALHRPSLLGFRTFTGRFEPVEPPHPSVHAARALAGAADFRFSFLPNPTVSWVVQDARDGRFVLDRDERGDGTFTTIAVCDPLFRSYVLLPQIPEDLAATVQDPHVQQRSVVIGKRRCEIFLAPCGEKEEAAADQPQSFRVIWMAQCRAKIVAFVFSSSSRQWEAIASPRWRDINPTIPLMTERQSMTCRNYAYGCFYWVCSFCSLVVLDMDRMEFYHVNPLSRRLVGEFAMVELGDSRCGLFRITWNDQPRTRALLQLFCANRQNHGVGASKWLLENEVPLSYLYDYSMLGYADGKLILQTRNARSQPEFGCISVDLKTLQPQEVRGTLIGGHGYRPLPLLYIGYPPSLSSPTI